MARAHGEGPGEPRKNCRVIIERAQLTRHSSLSVSRTLLQLRLTIRKNPKSNRQYVLDQETRQDTVGELLIDLDWFSAPLTSGQLLSNAKEVSGIHFRPQFYLPFF